MLPLEKASASPRNSPTSPELPMPVSADSKQQKDPGAIPGRTPADLEFSRLRFRELVYEEAAGPHQTLARLHELCCQWLQPEERSKEQMLELLVLEQFLGILPDKVRPWVVAQYPESCKKAASLVEGLAETLEEPGMLLGSPTGSSAFSEELCEKYAEPLLLPCEPTSPFTGPQETLALLETRWQALDPRLPEQGNIREDVQEEFKPAKVQLKKPKLLEETLGEWGHLDPAEENLRSYRKLLLWGYQLSQPDATSRLETEELQLVERELPGGSLSGSGRQQNKGNTCEGVSEPRVWTERFAGDSPVNPSSGITQEEEEQPWNVPDPQDGELSTVTVAQRQSVIQKPAQDRGGARLATVPQGLGVKRPHPEDKGGQDSQYIPRVSCHLPHDIGKEHNASCHSAGSLAGQDPASCPRDDKLGVSGRKPCYTCSECGQIFTWISHLMEHQRNHNGRKRYACQSCWKTFHFSLALAEHQKIHEKEKGYTFGVGLGSHPAAREAYAGGRLGGLPEYVGGDVFPGQPEAQR